MSHQCLLCDQWFHYAEDKPVCRQCWYDMKMNEYRNIPSYYGREEE